MRSIAKRLFGRLSAGAPEIGLSGFDIDGIGGLLGDFGGRHGIKPCVGGWASTYGAVPKKPAQHAYEQICLNDAAPQIIFPGLVHFDGDDVAGV